MRYISIAILIFLLSGCEIFSTHEISDDNDFSTAVYLPSSNSVQSWVHSFDKKDIYSVKMDGNGNFKFSLRLIEYDNFSGSIVIYDTNRNRIGNPITLPNSEYYYSYSLSKGNYYIEINRYSGEAKYQFSHSYVILSYS